MCRRPLSSELSSSRRRAAHGGTQPVGFAGGTTASAALQNFAAVGSRGRATLGTELGVLVALAEIALATCGAEVADLGSTAADPRHDVIDVQGELRRPPAAVLAGVAVPAEDGESEGLYLGAVTSKRSKESSRLPGTWFALRSQRSSWPQRSRQADGKRA